MALFEIHGNLATMILEVMIHKQPQQRTKEQILMLFISFNDSSAGILKDYYELTGKPALMPEYGFYEAHLNAYNRDYWVKVAEGTAGAVKFEDGNFTKNTNQAI